MYFKSNVVLFLLRSTICRRVLGGDGSVTHVPSPLGPDVSEWPASHPRPFTPREEPALHILQNGRRAQILSGQDSRANSNFL
jgi:hypothetical protein